MDAKLYSMHNKLIIRNNNLQIHIFDLQQRVRFKIVNLYEAPEHPDIQFDINDIIWTMMSSLFKTVQKNDDELRNAGERFR